MNAVTIGLKATGQALEVTSAPPVVASGVVDFMRFAVELSDEWAGFDSYAVLLKNGATVSRCEIVNGEAEAEAAAVAACGELEAAIMATAGESRLTTERVIIPLKSSGLEG